MYQNVRSLGELNIGEVTTTSIDTSFSFDVTPAKLTATLDQKEPFKRIVNGQEFTMTDTTRKFEDLTPLTDYTVEIAGSDGAGAQVALKKDVQTKGWLVQFVKVIFEMGSYCVVDFLGTT